MRRIVLALGLGPMVRAWWHCRARIACARASRAMREARLSKDVTFAANTCAERQVARAEKFFRRRDAW